MDFFGVKFAKGIRKSDICQEKMRVRPRAGNGPCIMIFQKAGLSLLEASKGSRKPKKSLKKAKEAKGVTKATDNKIQATFQADLKKAKLAAENPRAQ
jgi:hypothetical protein